MFKDMRTTFYDKTEKQKKRILNYRKHKILNSDNKLLKKMVCIVEENMVKHHADFYIHDTELIKKFEGDPFLWVVREYGTHFIYLYYEGFKGNVWDQIPYFETLLHNFDDIKGFYLYENGTLKKIGDKKAFQTLEKYGEYMRRTNKKYA